MSSYKIIFFLITTILISIESIAKEPKNSNKLFLNLMSEDELIVRAIICEDKEDYINTQRYFSYLYKTTNKKEYLYKEVMGGIFANSNTNKYIKKIESLKNQNRYDLVVKRLLISLYLKDEQIDKAKEITNELIEYSDDSLNLEFASNTYIMIQDYDNAIKLLNHAYNKNFEEDILLKLVAILVVYQQKDIEAIMRLETHKRMVGSSSDILKYLVDLYIQTSDAKNLVKIYKELYLMQGDDQYLQAVIDMYISSKDYKSAIEFLEMDGEHLEVLYELYKIDQNYNKAFLLAQRIYKITADARWLAELGVLSFEKYISIEKKNNIILKQSVKYFEKALKLGVEDSIYLNYYGYTLIDSDININKGIMIINKALKEQPNNSYFLDSLAWGYYKNKNCKKAYDIMKIIIDKDDLLEEDMKHHWDKIKNCTE